MRTTLMTIVLAMSLLAAPGAAAADDEPNTTCRIDAAAVQAVLDAQISCLQLDTETHGEFDAAVTVTLQYWTADGWTDAATNTCTGASTEGVLELSCSATSEDLPPDEVRGLIDLAAPKDWPVAVAEPTYTAGAPIAEPLAVDECDLNETYDASDLSVPDAPWADLCAVSMSSQLDDHGELESVSVTTHVTWLPDERTPTTTWMTQLVGASGCTHKITVADGGPTRDLSAGLTTGCDYEPVECTGILRLVTDAVNGSCAAAGSYGAEESVTLPAEAVTFDGAMVVTLRPGDVPSLAASDFALGSTIQSVSAATFIGIGGGGVWTTLDADFAGSTGRTYTIGG